jgi:hypothetical protein
VIEDRALRKLYSNGMVKHSCSYIDCPKSVNIFFCVIPVHTFTFVLHFTKLNKTSHTKHFVFHSLHSSAMYEVCFDLFRYLSRRRG